MHSISMIERTNPLTGDTSTIIVVEIRPFLRRADAVSFYARAVIRGSLVRANQNASIMPMRDSKASHCAGFRR
jgi:hypothetical protein